MPDKRRIVLVTVQDGKQTQHVIPFETAAERDAAIVAAQQQAREIHRAGGTVESIDQYRESAAGKIDHEENCPIGDLDAKE